VDKPTVLLADDSHRILSVASRLLEADCEIVATACDGECALLAVNQFKPELVVLDINMPGTDGIQTARQLQKLGSIPRIVFLTVNEDPDMVQVACAMGASYVVKARMYSDLLVAIKEALAGRVFVSSCLMGRHTRLGIR
jgi:DNA-binding NarL/FixJ family response regulator